MRLNISNNVINGILKVVLSGEFFTTRSDIPGGIILKMFDPRNLVSFRGCATYFTGLKLSQIECGLAGDAEVLPCEFHVRGADGQGDHQIPQPRLGKPHAGAVRNPPLQKEP